MGGLVFLVPQTDRDAMILLVEVRSTGWKRREFSTDCFH
jgi:hypothetical protein